MEDRTTGSKALRIVLGLVGLVAVGLVAYWLTYTLFI